MLAPSSHVARLRVLLFTSLVFMGSASLRPTDDCSGGLGAHGKWTIHFLRGNDPIDDSRRLDGGSAVPEFGGSIRIRRPGQNPLPSGGNRRWLPTLRTGTGPFALWRQNNSECLSHAAEGTETGWLGITDSYGSQSPKESAKGIRKGQARPARQKLLRSASPF